MDLSGVDKVSIAGDYEDGKDTTGKVTPTLIGEDPGKHSSALVEVGSVGNNGGGHRIVTSDADPHH